MRFHPSVMLTTINRDIYFLLWWNSEKLNRCSGKQTLNTHVDFSVFIPNSSKDIVFLSPFLCFTYQLLRPNFIPSVSLKFFLSIFPPDLDLPVHLGTFCDLRTDKETPGHCILKYLISSSI